MYALAYMDRTRPRDHGYWPALILVSLISALQLNVLHGIQSMARACPGRSRQWISPDPGTRPEMIVS